MENRVTNYGIGTDPNKVAAIAQLEHSSTVRNLRQYLGVAPWYRRPVPDFARIGKPLNDLLRGFEEVKARLMTDPMLACPDFGRAFKGKRTPATTAFRERIMARFGVLKMLITDYGVQFASRAFKKFRSTVLTKKKRTSARTGLKTMITKFAGQKQRNWDERWAETMLDVNSSVSESTGKPGNNGYRKAYGIARRKHRKIERGIRNRPKKSNGNGDSGIRGLPPIKSGRRFRGQISTEVQWPVSGYRLYISSNLQIIHQKFKKERTGHVSHSKHQASAIDNSDINGPRNGPRVV